LAARIFPLELASESAGSAALAGAGLIGASTGAATIPFTTIIGITPEAERSTTGTPSTDELQLRVVVFDQERRRGLRQPRVGRGLSSIVLERRPGPSRGASPLPEATLRPAAKAEFTQALSATTTMAERQEPIPRVEAPASVAERVAVAVGMAGDTTDPDSFE